MRSRDHRHKPFAWALDVHANGCKHTHELNFAFSKANAIICESDGYSEARLQNSIKLFINVCDGEHRAINLETLKVEIEQYFSPEAKKIIRTASWLDCYEPLSNTSRQVAEPA